MPSRAMNSRRRPTRDFAKIAFSAFLTQKALVLTFMFGAYTTTRVTQTTHKKLNRLIVSTKFFRFKNLPPRHLRVASV